MQILKTCTMDFGMKHNIFLRVDLFSLAQTSNSPMQQAEKISWVHPCILTAIASKVYYLIVNSARFMALCSYYMKSACCNDLNQIDHMNTMLHWIAIYRAINVSFIRNITFFFSSSVKTLYSSAIFINAFLKFAITSSRVGPWNIKKHT